MERPEDLDDKPRTNAELREVATGRMIQTAIRLIARDGASRLSLVDVGRESGYSHSLPNYYFKTKQKLLLEVYAYIVEDFTVRSSAWVRKHFPGRVTPGLVNIDAAIRSYLALVRVDPERSRAMNVIWAESFSSMPGLLEEVRPSNARTQLFFEEQIRVGVALGEIDPAIDPKALAVVIVSTLRGAVSQYLIDAKGVDLGAVADALAALLRKGVRPAGS
jgi:AcrR family transcriptional regulator